MRRNAFTLAETAISLALVGLVLLFVLNLFPSALVAQRSAEERTQAAGLARTLLEKQMNVAFAALQVGLRTPIAPVTIDGIDYSAELQVDSTPQADPKYLRVLRVVINWKSRNRNHTLQREIWKHRLPHQV